MPDLSGAEVVSPRKPKAPPPPPPKRPRGRPRKPAQPPGDMLLRLRALAVAGIEAMEARMAELRALPSDDAIAQIVTLSERCVVWMGHVRRSEDAMRQAARKLSPAAVIEYLRGLDEEGRAALLAETANEEPARSVLA